MENAVQTEKQQNNEELKTLVDDVIRYGDMLLIANKGVGKTNALMVLAEQFKNLPDTRVIVFEDFPKFCLEFSAIPYFIVKDNDVTETSHTIDMEDYFLRHDRDYSVKRGNEIKEALENNKDLIFTMQISDIERSAFFIYSIVQYFYRKHYLRKFKGYSKTERIVFVIEESQNVFDSSTISKKIFNRLRKIFSIARNLDLHFVLASQRLQDLNTKIRGRTRLLIGQVSLDDYELKVRSLLRHSKHKKDILTLERGSFLYTATDEITEFPKFIQQGKPYQIKPKPQPCKPQLQIKKKNKLTTIMNTVIGLVTLTPQIDPSPTEQELYAKTFKAKTRTLNNTISEPDPDSEDWRSESEQEIDESEDFPDQW